VAEGAIAERTLPESLSFIAIYGIDPAVVRPCHGGQVNEASNDVNHRSHCPPGFDSLYTCDQWTRTGSTTAPMRTRKPINMYTTITTTENSCANPSDLVFASVAHRSLLSATSRPLRARNPDESIHVLPVPVRHLEGAVDGCTRTFWDACLGNARDRRATPSRRSGALQFAAIPAGSRARPSPGPKRSENGTYATVGRVGRLRHARGYAPPRIHRRGWLARHASRFSGVGARPRTPVPERGRRTTTRVQPGATTRPRRRSLRSRPRGCRRPRALRWQPSARV
jgi:hypothetical protein